MSVTWGSARLPVSGAVATVLSSVCLGSTFLTGAWFFPAFFAVLAVVTGGEVARRTSAPRSLVPAAGAVALLLYLVLLYARDEAYLWVIPNHDALVELGDLVRSGRADTSRFAAPIAVSPGIELLVTGGVGLVALAVDTLAVTMRRAALAGLPLLVLYTVPTTVAPNGVGWLAFALGGIGYLTLLLAEARERVSRWGRPMRYIAPRAKADWRPDVETAPLAQVGRRVGAAALGLALVVPAVLPDLDAATFGFGGGFGPGGGGGRKVDVVNPIFDLGKDLRRGSDRPVISYTGRPDYLRMVGLDLFLGDKWDPSAYRVSNSTNDVEHGLAPAAGLGPAVQVKNHRYSFQIFDLDETWLPLPYPTRLVTDIDGKWLYDAATSNVFPRNGSTRQISYRTRSLQVIPTAQQLQTAGPPADALSRFTQLPADVPQKIIDTAFDVTSHANTQFEKALALQAWLRDRRNFAYNTHVSSTLGDANGLEAISRFLDTREGYCVHFASTMAVMARELGIPARVAVGFTAGRPDQKTGRHVVTLHDAHAWPELYFQGVGWTRFEPTPAGARTPVPGFTDEAALGGIGANPGDLPTTNPRTGDRPVPQASTRIPQGAQPLENSSTTNKKRKKAVPAPARAFPLVPVSVAVAALLLALVPLTARTWVRRRRWRRAASPAALAAATWDELRDTLLDYGYAWPASDPPRRGAARLVAERGLTGETRAALGRLASATERARYATELGAVGDLRSDVDTVRAALAAGASRATRLRARFLPRSARAVSSAMAERLADLLDELDKVVARPRLRATGK